MRRLAFFLVLLALPAWAETPAPAAPELPVDLISRLLRIPIPERVEICGEIVPLDREDVRERLEYEMAVILGSPVQTSTWLKRVPRYFPDIEQALLAKGLPLDLRFVSVVESNLKAESLSSAGASGPWQFIPDTARAFGLRREVWCDERRDWGRSTEAALTYLSSLKNSLGAWTLAFAAYNAGEGRVRGAMDKQGESDFYGLKLPTETERYVLRIIAAKLILENPGSYGIDLSNADLHEPLATREVCFDVKRGVSLVSVAKAAGVSYRYFLRLNPGLNGADLPRGRHTLLVPDVNADAFVARLLELERPEQRARVTPLDRKKAKETLASAQEIPAAGQTHQVQPGDTLSSIARRYDVRLGDLMAGNGLTSDSVIKPGQELKVPESD